MIIEAALLTNEFQLSDFDSGDEFLNTYLKQFALLYRKRRFGITVVFFQKDDPSKKVVGYYTICPASVQRNQHLDKMIKGPKPSPLPAWRLCRLALDLSLEGKGLGQVLMIHALKKCLDNSELVGGALIVVDAKNERAKKFYENFGFKLISKEPMVLAQSIKWVASHLE